ncbi:RNA-directed DNA polymerase, eukaryota, reverse transcriptase zinc-binding domain protein [Tanacetum coccineum]
MHVLWLNISSGVGSLVGFNIALILKWWWRFINNESMLWVRVIKNIYGSQGGFDKDHLRATGPQPWARLLSLLSRLKAKTHLRGGMEQSQFQDLMERLQSFSCSSNVDSWIWNPDPSGDFTVKYTRRWLDDIILPTNLMVTRWNPLVPKKVNIFCWRMFLNRIPTRLLLDSRGIDIPNVLCPICGIDQEDITHLFLKCEVTSEIWRAIFTWLGSVPPDIGSIKDLFLWIDNNHMVAKKKKGFEAICLITC